MKLAFSYNLPKNSLIVATWIASLSFVQAMKPGELSYETIPVANVQTFLKEQKILSLTEPMGGSEGERTEDFFHLMSLTCKQLEHLTVGAWLLQAYLTNLHYEKIDEDFARLLKNNSSLKTIRIPVSESITKANLGKISLEALLSCTGLENCEFTWWHHCLTDGHVDKVTQNCKRLKSVCLSHCRHCTVKSIYSIFKNCQNLEELTVYGAHFLKGIDWKKLSILPSLKQLDMSVLAGHGSFTKEEILGFIEHCPDIEKLDLFLQANVDDDLIEVIFRKLKKLKTICHSDLNNHAKAVYVHRKE